MYCLINSLLISKYLFHTMNILFYILSFVNITVLYNGRSHYYLGSGCPRCKAVDFQIIYIARVVE